MADGKGATRWMVVLLPGQCVSFSSCGVFTYLQKDAFLVDSLVGCTSCRAVYELDFSPHLSLV